MVGKSRSHVANTLRLLALPEHAQDLLSSGAISAGHARALLATPDPDAVADRIVARGLTVRDVEKLARSEITNGTAKKGRIVSRDVNTKSLQNQIALALGADVDIRSDGSNYEIRIRLQNLEQLNYICEELLKNKRVV